MHPILQRIKDQAAADAGRHALAAALRPQSAQLRRLAAWQDLRADLRAALNNMGKEEADFLVEQLAPPEPPERFNGHVDTHVCVLVMEGHAPVQLLLTRQQGRWRPAGPGRVPAWCLAGTMFADLGVALVHAQRAYDEDPDFYERLLAAHVWEPERGPSPATPAIEPGQVEDLERHLDDARGQPRPAEAEHIPEAIPADQARTDDTPPWEGGSEIDAHRPSKKKRGGGS